MSKRRWVFFVAVGVGAVLASTSGYDDFKSLDDQLGQKVIPPITCHDILFSTFNMDSDFALFMLYRFAYTACIRVMALEDQLTRASEEQKPMMHRAIDVVNRLFLYPMIVAFRLAPFVFTNTQLRERLNDSTIDAQEGRTGDFAQ